MNETNTQIPPRRSRAARIALVATGAFTGLVAAGALAAGGLALWGDAQKDDDGYLSTGSHRFAASSHALATENLDIDLDGAESVFRTNDFGDIRLKVAPETDKPVFVGIARTDGVSAYLGDVAHRTVTDVDYTPFDASYSSHEGARQPGPPAEREIWAASAQGAGQQTLNWDIRDGDWSVVVMNADGSPGVQADISAGAKAPFLDELGWSAIGGGAFLLLVAAGLIVLAVRPPRNPSGKPQGAGLAPAAA
jgi:hypothetical protein